MVTQDAIRTHGACAVYRAAYRHMADGRSLAEVDLRARSLGDVWRIMGAAYEQMSETEQAIDYTDAQARLTEISK